MSAQIIDGKAVAQAVRREVAEDVAALRARGVTPGLAVILVGDDAASQVYVRNKEKACADVGITAFDHRLPADAAPAALQALLRRLSADPAVHGVLLQLPLPGGADPRPLLSHLDPSKDVDGLLAENVGRLWLGEAGFRPCTPAGCLRLLDEARTPLQGADAVIVGRSNLVGKPLAGLLLARDATVTLCHSRTRDLAARVRAADIVVAAIGRPELIRGDWIKEGATVIDVGINRRPDGTLVGDVEFARARERAAAITPVPGGVGPMTIAMLLRNTADAARRSLPH